MNFHSEIRVSSLLAVFTTFLFFIICSNVHCAEGQPEQIKIESLTGAATVYSQPNTSSDPVDTALNGMIYDVLSHHGEFVEIKVVDKKTSGYVLKRYTIPHQEQIEKPISPLFIAGGAIVFLLTVLSALIYFRMKKSRELEKHTAAIQSSIKKAEEHFRNGEYDSAALEFNKHISLQGGEVRNPDVYRRLAICHHNISEVREAAKAWETMKSLGGLRGVEDYSLGVDLMIALGKESEAAEIYEQLLLSEDDEEKRHDIHKKLYQIYRQLKNAEKLLEHAIALKKMGIVEPRMVTETANFLIAEGKTDLAISNGDTVILKTICKEFIEDGIRTPEASRLYLKCLEFDRTDKALHRMLADIYKRDGDFRKAVSELIILQQVDKDRAEEYVDEAARIYCEHSRISEAIAEGNPQIIKKIAQFFLVRSEVHTEAIEIYEKVLEFQPKAVGINKMLSTVYLTRGDLSRYVEKLKLLQEIDGRNHDYYSDLAKCIIDNNLIEETVKEGNRELNGKIVRQLIKKGVHSEEAVSLLEKLVKVDPESNSIRRALIKAYQNIGDPEKEYGHLSFFIKANQSDTEMMDRAAHLAVQLGDYQGVADSGIRKFILSVAELLKRNDTQHENARMIYAVAENSVISAKFPPQVDPRFAIPDDDASRKSGTEVIRSKEELFNSEGIAQYVSDSEFLAEVELLGDDEVILHIDPEESSGSRSSSTNEANAHSAEDEIEFDDSDFEDFAEANYESDEPKSSKDVSPEKKNTDVDVYPEEDTISISDNDVSLAHRALTTFVSSYEKTKKFRNLPREELFIPSAGGLAYKELDILRTDSWGNLHAAIEINTGKSSLIRIFRKDLLNSSDFAEFIRHVSDLNFNLKHENILSLEEVVRGPGDKIGFIHPFYPTTLDKLIVHQEGCLPDERFELGLQIIKAIGYAHNHQGGNGKVRRIYHLHLQPGLILADDECKTLAISCLGYSLIYRNLTRAKQPRWQEPGMNPAVMPPEFFKTKPSPIKEKSADIYCLGVVLYYLFTGEFPFEGPSLDDYKFQHTKIFAAPPRLINASVPDWLEPIILGCLEKEPDKRWESVDEILSMYTRTRR